MAIVFRRINYANLNSKQKESYNYQKASAALADYGFVTMRLRDDWQGADFIAQHIDGRTFMKVQLNSRPAFAKKYFGKDLFIAFFDGSAWYLYPHEEVLEKLLASSTVGGRYRGGARRVLVEKRTATPARAVGRVSARRLGTQRSRATTVTIVA